MIEDKKIGYYFITDSKLSKKGIIEDVKLVCDLGVKFIQYRNKEVNNKLLYEEAYKIKQICQGYDTKLIINDRLDIALAVDADGVHLGQDDVPYPVARKLLGKKKIIGVSTHNVAEARIAEFSNVDYIGVGAIYKTNTKKDIILSQGPNLIRDIKKVVSIPVIAIGGINMENFKEVVNSGADGLCSISDIVKYDDMKERILSIQNEFFSKN